jgi:hypothetical protein
MVCACDDDFWQQGHKYMLSKHCDMCLRENLIGETPVFDDPNIWHMPAACPAVHILFAIPAVDVDVNNQCIAVSALRTLTTPVPRGQSGSESGLVLHYVTRVNSLNKSHCCRYQWPPGMHQYRHIQHVHQHDLDLLKTTSPPANLISVQHFKFENRCQMCTYHGFNSGFWRV